jgi:hypothetical protein
MIHHKLQELLSSHKLDASELTDKELRILISSLHAHGLYIRYNSYTSFFDPEYHYMMYDPKTDDLKRVGSRAPYPDVSYNSVIRVASGLDVLEQNMALDVYCDYAPHFNIYGVSKHALPLYFMLDSTKTWKPIDKFSTQGMKFIDTSFVRV